MFGTLLLLLAAPAHADDAAPPPKRVHWSEVQLKHKVTPAYPEAARRLQVEDRCVVTVTITPEGVPDSVVPKDCPAELRESTVAAVGEWQWYPFRVGGAPVAVSFDLTLVFKLPSAHAGETRAPAIPAPAADPPVGPPTEAAPSPTPR